MSDPMAGSPARRAFTWGVVVAAVAGALAIAPSLFTPTEVLVKTSLGQTADDDVVASNGPVALRISHSALGFGALGPGETSAPVRLEVTNEGLVPFTLSVSATAMEGAATGATIAADRLAWGEDASGPSQDLSEPAKVAQSISPGGSTAFFLWLDVPSGGRQWIPQDDYVGGLLVNAEVIG